MEMRLVEREGCIPYYEFPALKNTGIVRHLFTTRLGGASHGYQESLNLNFNQGDEPEAVRENYHRVAKALGVEDANLVCSQQTHTTNVQRVGKEDAGRGVVRPLDITDIDGMVTDEPGIVLATFYADCVPLYFVDPVKKAIGLSHSGWKGTVNKMGQVTVDKMRQEFGSDPADIIAAIGPSICQKCYEVSSDVALRFIEKFGDTVAYQTDEMHYQLDLWKSNEIVLSRAGIKPENIHTAGICTCCNSNIFFSHRASNGKRGNLGAFLGLES